MGKICVEISLISARGLPRSSSLWKRQWFAVGWIDPNSKYCTKVDASGNENPVWRTKFAIIVDDSETNVQDSELNVEVYSMDPIFLTEKIHGSATVILKEFLAKKVQNSDQVRAYQLQKKDSSKPRGFIDISIRISKENEEKNSNPAKERGIVLLDRGNDTHLTAEGGSEQTFSQQLPLASVHRSENQGRTEKRVPYSHPKPFPANYSNPYVDGPSYPAEAGTSYQPPRTPLASVHRSENQGQTEKKVPYSHPKPLPANSSNPYVDGPSYPAEAGPSYQPPRTPSPPSPPSNVGYIPTFLPRNDPLPPSYINMPSSGAAPCHRGPPGFAMGVGAGALAAGALIFGDDFMSGFDVPPGLGDDNLT